ncbi:MAG: TRAP transporter small permease, partial [Nitrospinota bacterium]|nr:TRAP transporter small permease [Nitrospinota bacterium]
IPSRFKPILNILIGFLSGLITVFLAYAAWKFVEFEMESPTTLFFDIPAWIFQTILPFSFAVISLRYFLRVYDESVKFWNAR